MKRIRDRHRVPENNDTKTVFRLVTQIFWMAKLAKHVRRFLQTWLPIFGGVVLLLLLLVLTYVSYRLFRDRRARRQFQELRKLLKTSGNLQRLDPAVALSEQAELLEYKEQYEIPRKNVRFTDQVLGSGSFGKVVQAEAQLTSAEPQQENKWTKVAVKVVRDQGNIEQLTMLLKELKVHMFAGHHENVVNLLASVTKNFRLGEMFVVLEYCGLGSLKEFLLKLQDERYFVNQVTANGIIGKLNLDLFEAKRCALVEASKIYENIGQQQPKTALNLVATTNDLISISYQIACGMAYLAGKRVIHRDLAARNVLLTENLIAKVSDFGLARKGVRKEGTTNDAEYLRGTTESNNEPLPIKWLAPECIHHNCFSTASDVWAYGVTLWEVFALGVNPYANNPVSLGFIDKLTGGYRLQPPGYAPREISEIMQRCWNIDSVERPNFVLLRELMLSLLKNDKPNIPGGEDIHAATTPIKKLSYSELALSLQPWASGTCVDNDAYGMKITVNPCKIKMSHSLSEPSLLAVSPKESV